MFAHRGFSNLLLSQHIRLGTSSLSRGPVRVRARGKRRGYDLMPLSKSLYLSPTDPVTRDPSTPYLFSFHYLPSIGDIGLPAAQLQYRPFHRAGQFLVTELPISRITESSWLALQSDVTISSSTILVCSGIDTAIAIFR